MSYEIILKRLRLKFRVTILLSKYISLPLSV